jgi:hypothetical protein
MDIGIVLLWHNVKYSFDVLADYPSGQNIEIHF